MNISMTSLGMVGQSFSKPLGVKFSSAGLTARAQSWPIFIIVAKGLVALGHRYGASSSRLRAISASQRSPLSSSLALS